MERKVAMTRNGIVCSVGGTTISLDPKSAGPGLNFVSHAHADHVPTRNGGTILASNETSAIAGLRGFIMQNHVTEFENVSMYDAGHILGARGLLCEGIFYTGDICTRGRGFLQGAKIPKCHTLITECTFGLPEFVFPTVRQIQKQVNETISDLYSRGFPVILMGYQLGKAQTLTQLFGHWEPLYLHDSVKAMNDLHRGFGIGLKDAVGHSEAERRGLLDKRPWVMVAPMMSERSQFVRHMKSRYGALTIGFSGWAKSARFAFGHRCDYSVPLSDHCDFPELVDVVIRSGAEKVYAVHGFIDEFAAHLRRHGIDAQPLRPDTLDGFC